MSSSDRSDGTTSEKLLPAPQSARRRGRPQDRRGSCALALELIDAADVLIEGNRPGVAERLGVGPDVCCARNPRLVYGRMTGWGQGRSPAHTAGHDLTFLAASGLSLLARAGQPPTVPLAFVGDLGGARSCWRSGSSPRCMSARPPDAARWSTPPSSTVPPCSPRPSTGSRLGPLGRPRPGTWSTPARPGGLLPRRRRRVGRPRRAGTEVLRRIARRPRPRPRDPARPGRPRRLARAPRPLRGHHRRTHPRRVDRTGGGHGRLPRTRPSPWTRSADPHNASRGVLHCADGLLAAAPAPRLSRTPAAPWALRAGAGHPPQTTGRFADVLLSDRDITAALAEGGSFSTRSTPA